MILVAPGSQGEQRRGLPVVADSRYRRRVRVHGDGLAASKNTSSGVNPSASKKPFSLAMKIGALPIELTTRDPSVFCGGSRAPATARMAMAAARRGDARHALAVTLKSVGAHCCWTAMA